MNHLLFICTGNYYRSRFAEAVFNYLAPHYKIEWRAFSRGLCIEAVTETNDLSIYAQMKLEEMGIPLKHTNAQKVQISADDLLDAGRIVALKKDEHYPLMKQLFPGWAERIQYWEIHDLDKAQPENAMGEIYKQVKELLEELRSEAILESDKLESSVKPLTE